MWYIVERDGNPKSPNYYRCTLIAERENGQKIAYSDVRSFADVTNISDEYRMKGQPKTGLGWIKDADSLASETVYAWTDKDSGIVDNLPEGVIVVNRTDHDND